MKTTRIIAGIILSALSITSFSTFAAENTTVATPAKAVSSVAKKVEVKKVVRKTVKKAVKKAAVKKVAAKTPATK